MNKTQLINAMAADAGISKEQAKKALESLLRNIEKALKKGDRVSIVGFGSWSVSRRNARVGRNPSTGQTIKIPAKNVVKFKFGSELSDAVNDEPSAFGVDEVGSVYEESLNLPRSRGLEIPGPMTRSASMEPRESASVEDSSEMVNFKIMSPKTILPGNTFLLDLWAYLDSQSQRVQQMAEELGRDRSLGAKLGVEIEKGSLLTLKLDLDQFELKQSTSSIIWNGVPTNASFIVTTPQNIQLGTFPGTVEVSFKGLLICVIHFVLSVDQAEDSDLKESTDNIEYIKTAFASYASENRSEVLSRVQGMKAVAPELDVFVDVFTLRAGDNWKNMLAKHVPNKDRFFLFWSLPASESEWVGREWRMALEQRGINYIHPVPLEEPDKAKPPKELNSLHFNDFYLPYIKYYEGKGES